MGGQQGSGPGQYAFTRLGESFKTLASGDQFQTQFILKVAQAHGQRRLSNVAARSCLAEVSSLLQGDQEFELLDVHDGTYCRMNER
ncbi:hypothetical protein D3C72_1492640 [compost metagenome]